jgi:hypothetical protein
MESKLHRALAMIKNKAPGPNGVIIGFFEHVCGVNNFFHIMFK